MTSEEKKSQSVDSAKLSRLLDIYVVPAFQGLDLSGEPDILTQKDYGQVIAVQHCRGSYRPHTLAVMVAATPEGAKSVNTVRNIVFHVFDAKYRKSSSEANILVDIDGIRHDAAKLDALGFSGIYDPQSGGVVPWSVLLDSYQRKAKDHNLLSMQ